MSMKCPVKLKHASSNIRFSLCVKLILQARVCATIFFFYLRSGIRETLHDF